MLQVLKGLVPSRSMAVALVALGLAGTGTAGAAATGLFNGEVTTPKIHTGAVTSQKIHRGAVSWGKLSDGVKQDITKGMAVGTTAPGQTGPAGPQGPAGKDGTNGTDGAQGPQGPQGATGSDGGAEPGESIQTATPDLTLDAAPGPNGSQGSSGFGWDSASNGPVTDLTVGTDASFSATALALGGGSLPDTGQITFTFDIDYLTVSDPGSCTVPSGDYADGIVVCAWSGSHTDQSEGITFTPQQNVAETVVTATVTTNGEQVTQQVPISIG